ncbi:MAG: LD-carboxypeptidase [Prevotellaceae bacterium]|nr:LD-carboxypeptidase [Prevotellaceae bacterium]
MDSLLFPPYITKGDHAVIVSPSGKIDANFLQGARKHLKQWGLKVGMAVHAGGSHGWYAGTVRQRLHDLQAAFDNERVRLIFCSRGGYGAVHLIDRLDFTRFRQAPKWLVGFSDITALHNVIQHEGFASLHAPMARQLTVEPADDAATRFMRETLFGEALPHYTLPAHRLNHRGTATGILRGGNLAVLSGLRGTPYDIPAPGTILFVEDVGERPHSVERMFYNLKLGGVLEQLAGLIIGQFTEYDENLSLGKDLYAALADLLKEYPYPVCFDFPVGHTSQNMPLINGACVTLEVGKKETSLSTHPYSHD